MRNLTEDEINQVSGRDGFYLGGNSYVSTTRLVTGALGIVGAASVAFEAGYLIGTGLNNATGAMYGTSTSEAIGGYFYENS